MAVTGAGAASEKFMTLMSGFAESLEDQLTTPNGDWIVKGFVDTNHQVYSISGDTKVVSKLIELMLFPRFQEFAEDNGYELLTSKHQNHYPDMTFIDEDGYKFALDVKSTYHRSATQVNTMTLGAFTGYFRQRESTKNVLFPYGQYSGHFVFGITYWRAELPPDELIIKGLEDIDEIPSVVRDLNFFVQPKYRIASPRPGSGNTKNIGAVTNYQDLINGNGPFSEMGEDVFDDYWMYYLTNDMARAVDLQRPPYTNLQSYQQYKASDSTVLEGKKDDILSAED